MNTTEPSITVFVTVKPSALLPSISPVTYPVTGSSEILYSIGSPSSLTKRLSNEPVHSLPALSSSVLSVFLPLASKWITTLSGRTWYTSSRSTQTLVTFTCMVSGVCVFVTVKPAFASPVTSAVYLSTLSSDTVYSIGVPLRCVTRPVKLPVHLLPAFNSSIWSVFSPLASKWIVTLSGRTPSRLLSSTHFLATVTLVRSKELPTVTVPFGLSWVIVTG